MKAECEPDRWSQYAQDQSPGWTQTKQKTLFNPCAYNTGRPRAVWESLLILMVTVFFKRAPRTSQHLLGSHNPHLNYELAVLLTDQLCVAHNQGSELRSNDSFLMRPGVLTPSWGTLRTWWIWANFLPEKCTICLQFEDSATIKALGISSQCPEGLPTSGLMSQVPWIITSPTGLLWGEGEEKEIRRQDLTVHA